MLILKCSWYFGSESAISVLDVSSFFVSTTDSLGIIGKSFVLLFPGRKRKSLELLYKPLFDVLLMHNLEVPGDGS